ncbi:MAG: hypothetical protein IJT43_02895 [Stomatobaculum sp.]|nr:hypothetical protein [Stomatobaculum sp.]
MKITYPSEPRKYSLGANIQNFLKLVGRFSAVFKKTHPCFSKNRGAFLQKSLKNAHLVTKAGKIHEKSADFRPQRGTYFSKLAKNAQAPAARVTPI